PGPRLERVARAADGAVDVGRVARRDLGESLAGRRVDAIERLPVGSVGVVAVDERLRPDVDGRAIDRHAHGAPPGVAAGASLRYADSAISSRYVIETRESEPWASAS